MKKVVTILTFLFISVSTLPTTAEAVKLLIDQTSNELYGASSVFVDDEYYDVEFKDGTCNELFNGCANFTFDLFTAPLASKALLDQVFINEYDLSPDMTRGISFSLVGHIFTPYYYTPISTAYPDKDMLYLSNATNVNTIDGDQYSNQGWSDLFFTDTTTYSHATYAIWTEAAPVPEPSTLILMSASLLGLILYRMNRQH